MPGYGASVSQAPRTSATPLVVWQAPAGQSSNDAAGTPDDAAATARAVIDAGAVGLNLEDAPGVNGAAMLDAVANAARIAAARAAATQAGVDLIINARTDIMLKTVGDEATRFDETVRRAALHIEAGADGIVVPGVSDAETISRLAKAIGAPLNVIGGPGVPSTAELRALGVARVSIGPGLARSVMAHIRRAATEVPVPGPGTHESFREQVSSPDTNLLFKR